MGLAMLGIDPDVGHLRFWVASGAAALLVLACALALDWTRSRIIARCAVVGLGVTFGAILVWAFLVGAAGRDLSVERRDLEMRATQLAAQVLAPGSPLACLDETGGENVEAACEKALFATPATVAAASSYTLARLALLSDMAVYIKAGGDLDSVLPSMRRALETDRFGFVAHTLALRDGCTVNRCAALALFRNPDRVRANFSAQTFDRYVDRYAALWGQPGETPVAETTLPSTGTLAAGQPPSGQGQKKVVVDIDFPTSASIPPVSIMNPEQKGPPANVADANARSAASARRPSRKAASSPPPPVAAAPVQPAVDPVWAPKAAVSPGPQPGFPPQPAPPPQASAVEPAAAQ
jgi:hypothetical protein